MRVRALVKCFVGGGLRHPGEEFEHHKLDKRLEPVDPIEQPKKPGPKPKKALPDA